MKQSAKPYFVYPPIAALALYASVMGSLIPAIRAAFPGLTLASAGLFSTLQSLGTALSVILCFCLFSALNKVRIMALCQLVLAACLLLFGFNSILLVLYALLFFIGLFTNIVDTLSNSVLADIEPQRKAYHINMLQALWAASAVAGPWFTLVLGGTYPPVFIGLSIVVAAAGTAFAFGFKRELRQPFVQRRDNFGALGKLVRTLKLKGMALLLAISFFNAFVLVSFSYFISSYILSIGGNSTDAAFALSMLFVGTLLGRLIYAPLSHRIPARTVMLTANVLSVAAFAGISICADVTWAGILACIGGIGTAVNFPSTLVHACALVPNDTASGSALVFLGFTLAALTAPPLIGAIGDAVGLKIAMLCATSLLLAVIALAWRLKPQPE